MKLTIKEDFNNVQVIIDEMNDFPKYPSNSAIPKGECYEFEKILRKLPLGTVFSVDTHAGTDTYEKTDNYEYMVQDAPWYDFTIIGDIDVAERLLSKWRSPGEIKLVK